MATYESLAESIVEKEKDVLGEERALEIAEEVTGVSVEEQEVEISGRDAKQAVDELASAYIDNLGKASAVSLRMEAKQFQGEIELPSALQ
jgi:hypothetical protein